MKKSNQISHQSNSPEKKKRVAGNQDSEWIQRIKQQSLSPNIFFSPPNGLLLLFHKFSNSALSLSLGTPINEAFFFLLSRSPSSIHLLEWSIWHLQKALVENQMSLLCHANRSQPLRSVSSDAPQSPAWRYLLYQISNTTATCRFLSLDSSFHFFSDFDFIWESHFAYVSSI